jgi:hypothetical protein
MNQRASQLRFVLSRSHAVMVCGDGLLVLSATAVIDKDLMTRMRRRAISAAP